MRQIIRFAIFFSLTAPMISLGQANAPNRTEDPVANLSKWSAAKAMSKEEFLALVATHQQNAKVASRLMKLPSDVDFKTQLLGAARHSRDKVKMRSILSSWRLPKIVKIQAYLDGILIKADDFPIFFIRANSRGSNEVEINGRTIRVSADRSLYDEVQSVFKNPDVKKTKRKSAWRFLSVAYATEAESTPLRDITFVGAASVLQFVGRLEGNPREVILSKSPKNWIFQEEELQRITCDGNEVMGSAQLPLPDSVLNSNSPSQRWLHYRTGSNGEIMLSLTTNDKPNKSNVIYLKPQAFPDMVGHILETLNTFEKALLADPSCAPPSECARRFDSSSGERRLDEMARALSEMFGGLVATNRRLGETQDDATCGTRANCRKTDSLEDAALTMQQDVIPALRLLVMKEFALEGIEHEDVIEAIKGIERNNGYPSSVELGAIRRITSTFESGQNRESANSFFALDMPYEQNGKDKDGKDTNLIEFFTRELNIQRDKDVLLSSTFTPPDRNTTRRNMNTPNTVSGRDLFKCKEFICREKEPGRTGASAREALEAFNKGSAAKQAWAMKRSLEVASVARALNTFSNACSDTELRNQIRSAGGGTVVNPKSPASVDYHP